MPDTPLAANQVQLLQQGLALPPERKFYFNGIVAATSLADVVFILLQNNQPVAVLNAPYAVAKALAKNLDDLLSNFEENTGQHIMTLDELNSKLTKEE